MIGTPSWKLKNNDEFGKYWLSVRRKWVKKIEIIKSCDRSFTSATFPSHFYSCKSSKQSLPALAGLLVWKEQNWRGGHKGI